MKAIIDPKSSREYWEKNTWFPPEYENNNFEVGRLSALIISYLNMKNIENPSIIEFCTGKGDFTSKFLSLYKGQASSYYCVDLNRHSLDLLISNPRIRMKDKLKIIHGYIGDDDLISKLPNEADVIICSRAIMHLPDLNTFFLMIKHLVSKRGFFVADIVPRETRMDLLKEKYGTKAYWFNLKYKFGTTLARFNLGKVYLTKKRVLMTVDYSINELREILKNSKMEIFYEISDKNNHFYRFLAK